MPDYLKRVIIESFKQKTPVIYKCVELDNQGRYWITSDGRLLSVCRNTPRYKLSANNGKDYLQVEVNGEKQYLHRLLALSFNKDQEKEKIKNTCEVHHLDFNSLNNNLNNLCIITPEKHRIIHTLYRRWEQCQQNI